MGRDNLLEHQLLDGSEFSFLPLSEQRKKAAEAACVSTASGSDRINWQVWSLPMRTSQDISPLRLNIRLRHDPVATALGTDTLAGNPISGSHAPASRFHFRSSALCFH